MSELEDDLAQDSRQDVYVINSTINNVQGNQINVSQLQGDHVVSIFRLPSEGSPLCS
jgi:hypothetical protein